MSNMSGNTSTAIIEGPKNMIRNSVIAGLVLALCVGPVNAAHNDTLRCVAGLKVISSDISASRPELSPKLARGLYGNLLMSTNEAGEPIAPQDLPPGSPSDAKYCVGESVDQASLNVLLKSYFGYLSDDPSEDIVECYAGFLSVGAAIEQKLGAEVGYDFGLMAGKKLGALVTSLNYLFIKPISSLEDLQGMAVRRLEVLSNVSDVDRERHIESYLDMCEWYGVPIRSMYDGAMTLNRK